MIFITLLDLILSLPLRREVAPLVVSCDHRFFGSSLRSLLGFQDTGQMNTLKMVLSQFHWLVYVGANPVNSVKIIDIIYI